METSGIPLGVVHPGSTGMKMTDTQWYPWGLIHLFLLYITYRHKIFGYSPMTHYEQAVEDRELTQDIGMKLNALRKRLLSGGIGLVHELTTRGWGMR